MTRRSFLPALTGAAAISPAGAATPDPRSILDLRYIYLRTNPDNQRRRVSQFLEKSVLPLLKRTGSGPAGVFSSSVGPNGPFLMVLSSYPSLAAMDEAATKMAADTEFQKGLEAFDSQPGLNYERQERMLLRSFESVALPPADAKRPGRLFEVRMYESNNTSTLRRKINMFNKGEAAIFRKLGMSPVFFGEMLVGPRMPNLVYMLGYDDLAAREKAWRAFGSDPDWAKMRETPGWADTEIVSNISNFFVSPLPFSEIR